MSSSIPRSRLAPELALLALLVFATACECRRCGGAAQEVARVADLTGTVEWSEAGGAWRTAGVEQPLGLEDALRTGADGSATVSLSSGGSIQLAPNSRLSFVLVGEDVLAVLQAGQLQAEAGSGHVALGGGAPGEQLLVSSGSVRLSKTEKGLRTESDRGADITLRDGSRLKLSGELQMDKRELDEEFDLVLQSGEVEVEAGSTGKRHFRLMFGEASMVAMESGRGKFSKTETGANIQMILGSALIEEDGVQRMIGQGASYDMRVGRVELIRREEIETFLHDANRSSQVRSGGGRFRKSMRVERLAPGSELEVSGRDSVALIDGKTNRLELMPGSAARFGGVFLQGKERQGEIEILRGELALRLRRKDEQPLRQKVTTPLGTFIARARGLTSEADIRIDERGVTLQVHSGQVDATLGNKIVNIPAGSRFSIDKTGTVDGPSDMPLSTVVVRQGKSGQVFFDRLAPPVTFSFQMPDGGQALLEIATRQDMKQLLLSEPLNKAPFAYRLLKAGSYYWRVRPSNRAGDPPPASLLLIKPDPYLGLAGRGKGVINEVSDTGVDTRVIFQGKAPSLRFTWTKTENTSLWLFRLYTADRLEKPYLEQKLSAPHFELPTGRLSEGTYYWYQAALDANGRQVRQSQMNKLVLQFDNAAMLLHVDSPQSGERPVGGQVLLRGLATEGAKLSANGLALQLDSRWRFNQMLTGVRPGGLVVFRLEKPGLADTYFVRQLGK